MTEIIMKGEAKAPTTTDHVQTLEETQIIAAVPEQKKHESRLRMDQAIEQEVRDAMTETQFKVAELLAQAGVPINEFPDTEEGTAQLHAWMKEHEIQVDKLVFQDNFARSGYYVMRAGIEIGMVPCRIVRGVMI